MTTSHGQPVPELLREAVKLVAHAMGLASGDKPLDPTRLTGYELEAPAKAIVPYTTPLVNMLPRRGGTGVPTLKYSSVLGFATDAHAAAGLPFSMAAQVRYVTAEVEAPFTTLPVYVHLHDDWWTREPDSDLRSRRMAETLYQLKLSEERFVLEALIAAANTYAPAKDGEMGPVVRHLAPGGALHLDAVDEVLTLAYIINGADPDFLICPPHVQRGLEHLVRGKPLPFLHGLHIQTEGADAPAIEVRNEREDEDEGDPLEGVQHADLRLTHYVNKTTGKEIVIVPHRACPEGTILFLSMTMPYPVPRVAAAVEMEVNQEYWGCEFPAAWHGAINGADEQHGPGVGVFVNEVVRINFLGGLALLKGIVVP